MSSCLNSEIAFIFLLSNLHTFQGLRLPYRRHPFGQYCMFYYFSCYFRHFDWISDSPHHQAAIIQMF
jgi:hypothetical protein